MNTLKKIFKKERGIIIGALHLPPLFGYDKDPGIDVAVQNALKDLKAFEDGGADAVIFENNYDEPHKTKIDSEAAVEMTYIGAILRKQTKLPLGVSVLWNDYETALAMAKCLGLQFVRIPVFVDDVQTSYAFVKASAKKVVAFRKRIKAENVLLVVDVHVKHSKIMSKRTITESAKLSIKSGADILILTGNWTGQAPDMEQLREVRKVVGKFPLFAGSGIDASNAKEIYKHLNGAIVSTSLKKGVGTKDQTNIKGYYQRIDKLKVKKLKQALV